MTEKKFLLISMEDEKSKHLADVLGSKTCKKIIDLLAENKELSEQDIAKQLEIPLNTVEYNLNKLMKTELIQKSKTFFWSSRGKKIPTYTLSNKSIIISPKSSRVSSKIKSILPVVILSGIAAVLIKSFLITKQTLASGSADILKTGSLESANLPAQASSGLLNNPLIIQPSPIWIWFLAGALFALVIFAILNWRKI
jgi:predicted transcriptional regulator